MIPVPSGVRVWLAVGRTDMRRGMNGLALQVQEALGGTRMPAIYMFSGAPKEIVRHSASFVQRLGSQRVLSSWKRL